jgi:hypothetical protein
VARDRQGRASTFDPASKKRANSRAARLPILAAGVHPTDEGKELRRPEAQRAKDTFAAVANGFIALQLDISLSSAISIALIQLSKISLIPGRVLRLQAAHDRAKPRLGSSALSD